MKSKKRWSVVAVREDGSRHAVVEEGKLRWTTDIDEARMSASMIKGEIVDAVWLSKNFVAWAKGLLVVPDSARPL